MQQRKIGELVVDFNLYPRTTVDMVQVGYLKEAEAAKRPIDPIVICGKSRRIVDGVHRHKMYSALYDQDHLIDVIENRYRNEAEILAEAIRLNSSHGKMLSRCDRVHCLLLAEKVSLSIDEAAKAMAMTVETLTTLRADRVATGLSDSRKAEPIALKQTIRHMSGKKLTVDQVAANDKLSGMNQLFYVNQLITLIESDLLDMDNEDLLQRLQRLAGLIRKLNKAA